MPTPPDGSLRSFRPPRRSPRPADREPFDDGSATESIYESFLSQFTLAQGRLQSYIRSLVHDPVAADDVFQTTSLELWRSYASFREGTDFTAWSLGVARNKVLHYWRSQRRDRHVFSDRVLAHLADMTPEIVDEAAARHDALLACVESLPARQRQLITLFYEDRRPVAMIAARWNRSVHAVYKALKVLRRALLRCIEGRLAAEASDL